MNKNEFRQNTICLGVLALILAGLLAGCGSPLAQGENPLTKGSPEEIATNSPPSPTSTEEVKPVEMIRIRIVYDNYPYEEGLGTEWGFSAFITYKSENILFDTGGSGSLLLSNLDALEISPSEIQNVVLSHEHSDHTGGLQYLLSAGAEPNLYIPPSFSSGIKNQFQSQTQMVEVSPGMEIIEGIYSIGEMYGPPPEQSLVIETAQGLVVITGCAHPGVEKIVAEAKRQYEKDIYLVLGGFHLGNASDAWINQVISDLQDMGVKHVAPSHCTGDRTIGMFRNAFGEDFIQIGAGAEISIEG